MTILKSILERFAMWNITMLAEMKFSPRRGHHSHDHGYGRGHHSRDHGYGRGHHSRDYGHSWSSFIIVVIMVIVVVIIVVVMVMVIEGRDRGISVSMDQRRIKLSVALHGMSAGKTS